MWYDPLTTPQGITNAVHWVLGNPDVFLNTAGDVDLLKLILGAAGEFKSRPDAAVMDADLESLGITSLFTGDEI